MAPKTRGGTPAANSRGKRNTRMGRIATLAREAMQLLVHWLKGLVGSPLQTETFSTVRPRDREPTHKSVAQVDVPTSSVYRDAEPCVRVDWLSLFMKLSENKFGVFTGHYDPSEAHEWLHNVAETFDIMECPKEKRVEFAVFFLTDDARDWWDFTVTVLGPTSSSWEVFQEAFIKEYVSWKKYDFIMLQQRGRTVAQYIAELYKLASIFPELVPTVRARSEHFIRGLDPLIREQVNMVSLENFVEVLERAQWVEKCEEDIAREGQRCKAPGHSGSMGYGLYTSKNPPTPRGKCLMIQEGRKSWAAGISRGAISLPQSVGSSWTTKACFSCGAIGHLARDCPVNEVQCYYCNEIGHYRSHCPQRGKQA